MNNWRLLKLYNYIPNNLTLLRTMSLSGKPIESSIRSKLENNLKPTYLNVINESYMHNVPKGYETHFKVIIVSNRFEGESLLERHKIVQHLLHDELKNGVHALSIVAKTPDQWDDNTNIPPSPTCRGGFGK